MWRRYPFGTSYPKVDKADPRAFH